MNIFILDESPYTAAELQCDKHVVKMILETAQMLCTSHRLLDGDDTVDPVMYRATHKNHPCSIWARESSANYAWLYEHFIALCDEYTYRYGKTHLTDSKLREVLQYYPTNIKHTSERTPFALAMKTMAPECINESDPVGSYRAYYRSKKSKFDMKWTNRPTPDWFTIKEED